MTVNIAHILARPLVLTVGDDGRRFCSHCRRHIACEGFHNHAAVSGCKPLCPCCIDEKEGK